MKVKYKYAIYIICVHAALAVLIFMYFGTGWVWILAQLLLLASLYLGLRFFYLAHKPYRHLIRALKSVENQDFTNRFQTSGFTELDTFFTQYNALMAAIGEERLRLQGQGKFLEELIFSSPVGIVFSDYDGYIADVNPAAEKMLGQTCAQLKGTLLDHLRTQLGMQPGDNEAQVVQWQGSRLKATQTAIMHKGFLQQCLLLEDVTAEILHSEKAAYGKVIRMMAHEVNNTTGAINSILHSVHDELTTQQNAELGQVVQIAIERNRRMVQFLENFAAVVRIYKPNKQPVQLYNLMQGMVQLWEPEASRKSITLCLDLPADGLEPVQADQVQLEQVVANIIKNAIEAIDGNDGLIVATITQQGRGLIIANNGLPLSQEESRQMFTQPFFSTKERGQGIGLMLIREILQQHDARFSLQTDADGITRFVVTFP